MPEYFGESQYEEAVLQLFHDNLLYDYEYGPNITRDYKNPLYEEVLWTSLERINNKLPSDAIKEAVAKIKHIDSGTLVQKNAVFMDYLQNGVPVRYFQSGEEKNTLVYLIDYENIGNNDFRAVNQWTFCEYQEKRPDIILFVNGLPLVLIELKSPSRDDADTSEAYLQIQNYKDKIPSMFIYNAICVISDQTLSKAGTITSNETRFMEWKTTDGSYENTAIAQFDTFFIGIFEKNRFVDIIKNFICFSKDKNNLIKILAGYHQYFAVRKAIESTKHATITDGKAGVFWHTQGSGKSLSMVFYAQLLQKALNSPTIVVITDRNDLDDQLFLQFSKCKDFLRQTPVQANSRAHLKELLIGREANGIIFTTMQKFEEADDALTTRSNVIVMADEAHRGQYGLSERFDKEGVKHTGTARIIRDSLPNASFIGFTGTPISQKDRSTIEVFGNYIDIYDMTQAVEDGATKPVYYESRVIKLQLNEETIKLIDQEYDLLAEQADLDMLERQKKKLGRLDAILGADQTLDSLVDDIIDHYEKNRQDLLTGKAMIVAYSRPIAMKIYQKILERRPNWKKKLGIVMTSGNKDPEEWHELIGARNHKDDLAKEFKDDDSELKIAIVVDMWLTGFDVPSLATMYVYKPMSGHNLMQAIARVNRVYKDKVGGLVVDYIGIASALKQAMNDYTARDKKNYGDPDIASVAYPKFLEKLEICRDIFHGFDYEGIYDGTELERSKLISGGANYVLGFKDEEKKKHFIKEAMLLKQALSLCSSIVEEDMRLEAAYFDTIRSMIATVTGPARLTLKQINKRINELLKQSIKSEGVVKLTSDTELEFNIFDTAFLADVARMKERNLAIEMLKKLIQDQVTLYKRTNVVKSEKFSEIITRAMNAYYNGLIDNETAIQELLKLAKEIQQAHQQGNQLGLTPDEEAFYDALTKPRAIKDFYENEELIAITKELVEALRKNRTIDWQKKTTARANMRKIIKRLLKTHKYPPEEVPEAIQTVMHQCELWADEMI